jgi:ABC-type polysaccharide/polyol phosphate transport system ATPase subunit
MNAAVESHELTVRFRAEIHRTFKQMLARGWRETPRYVQALRGVTFSVGRGESVGIVGGNGAGKSTLLRTLTGIVTPDGGHAVTRGVVAPMIELSTGFESEFTGRENIYFNGALLGRSRSQMREREETIIEFSGIADQIDAPMRTYSLGMIARLAFSIAVETDAEILMIDEVLAVGDASFRERAVARIRHLVENGAALLLVTHELDLLRALCTRAIWLEHGAIVLDGERGEVLGRYEASRARS